MRSTKKNGIDHWKIGNQTWWKVVAMNWCGISLLCQVGSWIKRWQKLKYAAGHGDLVQDKTTSPGRKAWQKPMNFETCCINPRRLQQGKNHGGQQQLSVMSAAEIMVMFCELSRQWTATAPSNITMSRATLKARRLKYNVAITMTASAWLSRRTIESDRSGRRCIMAIKFH